MDNFRIHPHDFLTEREEEILQLIATPMSTKLIAEQLCITQGTLRVHIKNIYAKLNVHSRLEAILVFQNQKFRLSDFGE